MGLYERIHRKGLRDNYTIKVFKKGTQKGRHVSWPYINEKGTLLLMLQNVEINGQYCYILNNSDVILWRNNDQNN